MALALRTADQLDRVLGLVMNYGVFDPGRRAAAGNWASANWCSRPQWWTGSIIFSTYPVRRNSRPICRLCSLIWTFCPLFQVDSEDPLLDDSLFMAQRWQAAGNAKQLKALPGGVHGFDMLSELAIAKKAHQNVRAYIDQVLGWGLHAADHPEMDARPGTGHPAPSSCEKYLESARAELSHGPGTGTQEPAISIAQSNPFAPWISAAAQRAVSLDLDQMKPRGHLAFLKHMPTL